MPSIVIGLTGTFASGCTTIAKEFISGFGYEYISLASNIKELYAKQNKSVQNPTRKELQDFGNKLREENGVDFLAQLAVEKMKKDGNENKKWVVECFRNPGEIALFRKTFPNFYLVGIFANQDTRWDRSKKAYNNNLQEFEKDEERDKNDNLEYGQRVTDCFYNSDIVISNDKVVKKINNKVNLEYMELKSTIEHYIKLVEEPYSQKPHEHETIMSIAYSNSQRSSCMKRKVGAVIVDEFGNIFSSGYNEVPHYDQSCEEMYACCYRSIVKENICNKFSGDLAAKVANDIIKGIKVLDHCRALHAEENAILNVARFGSSTILKDSTLYTTTYPCNLCANKIAQVGISKVVYYEPYPMKEAKEILDRRNIDQVPFEGVTFRAYFRLYGGELK